MNKNIKGFLLVEMLVSLSIFALIAVSAAAALLAIMDANAKAQATRSVMDNMNVAIENMSRTLRVGSDYLCLDFSGSVIASCSSLGAPGISFIPQGKDRTDPNNRVIYHYFISDPNDPLSVHSINRTTLEGGSPIDVPLTAPEVKITGMRFFIIGDGVTTGQPRVFMIVSGKVGLKAPTVTGFTIQTTVTQRLFKSI